MAKNDSLKYGGYGIVARDLSSKHGPTGSCNHPVWVWDALASALSVSSDDAMILDLGSGKGRSIQQMVANGFTNVVGAEPDDDMLAMAKKNLPTITFVRAPANDLPFSDASFDAIVAVYSFNHFCREQRAIDEIKRVLKAGGVFMVITWPLGELKHRALRIIRGYRKDHPKRSRGYESGERSFAPLLRACGFQNVRTVSRVWHRMYMSREAYDWLASSGSFARIPRKKWPEIRSSLRELAAAEAAKSADGLIHRDIRVIVDIATK